MGSMRNIVVWKCVCYNKLEREFEKLRGER